MVTRRVHPIALSGAQGMASFAQSIERAASVRFPKRRDVKNDSGKKIPPPENLAP
jgi:hypothetical protein